MYIDSHLIPKIYLTDFTFNYNIIHRQNSVLLRNAINLSILYKQLDPFWNRKLQIQLKARNVRIFLGPIVCKYLYNNLKLASVSKKHVDKRTRLKYPDTHMVHRTVNASNTGGDPTFFR